MVRSHFGQLSEPGSRRRRGQTVYEYAFFSDAIAEAWFDQMADARSIRKDVAGELRKWRAAERVKEAKYGSRCRFTAECYLRVKRKRAGLPARSMRDLR